jgi:ribosomal protein S18 acetylase RimI-like enzyme
MNIRILRSDPGHLDLLYPLFSQYRTFYQQDTDEKSEREYLSDRMKNGEAVVFLAMRGQDQACGFVLLYPTFDSVVMGRIWVLHDLFVAPEERRQGTGRLLMEAAQEFCRGTGAVRVDLATAVTNTVAKPLYESMGYELDEEFHYYFLEL